MGWSRGAEEIYGYDADEAIGGPLAILGGEDVVAPALVAVHTAERLDIPTAVHRRKGGEEVAVSLTVTPLGHANGEAPGAILVAADVGEPRRIDARRRESEAKYRALTEQLPAVTYVHPLGERGESLYVSPQVSSMLGYSAGEWLAQPDLFFQLVHPEDRDRVTDEIAEASAATTPLRSEYRMLSRDGRVVWVRDEAVTVRDDDGRPLYVQGFLLDVSERRQAGEERERLLAAQRSAASEAADRQRKLDVLARASEILGSSRHYQATLRRVAELAVRDLADWCLVDLLDEEGNADASRGRARRAGQAAGARARPRARGRSPRGRPREAAPSSRSRACACRSAPAAARSAR